MNVSGQSQKDPPPWDGYCWIREGTMQWLFSFTYLFILQLTSFNVFVRNEEGPPPLDWSHRKNGEFQERMHIIMCLDSSEFFFNQNVKNGSSKVMIHLLEPSDSFFFPTDVPKVSSVLLLLITYFLMWDNLKGLWWSNYSDFNFTMIEPIILHL